MSSGFFRGTNTEQVKHVNAEQKIIKEMQKNKRFPDHYAQKVDISKVSMDVMKPWIAKRITEMLGFEDDIVVDFCVAQLSEPGDKGLDPKMLQVNLTGFLERKAGSFVSELWQHLLSAQAPNPVFRRSTFKGNYRWGVEGIGV
ncbi:Srrm1 [Symbiodinium sp. KB8]|nr:Srrm1 [Symbiodinium sp. KB8]